MIDNSANTNTVRMENGIMTSENEITCTVEKLIGIGNVFFLASPPDKHVRIYLI